MMDCTWSEAAAEAGDDRLSALPDDILVDILERLDCLHSVVQTSTLSRRWRRLPLLLSRISIDICDDKLFSRRNRNNHSSSSTVMASYTEAARRLLANRAVKIQVLDLTLYLDDQLQSHLIPIGEAVGNAVAAESSKHVEMTLLPPPDDKVRTTYYYHVVAEPSAVHGQRFMSFLDACPGAFRCLTTLQLHRLRFAEPDAVPYVLSACRSLRELRLYRCGGQYVLRVDAPQLVTLKIVRCIFSRLELVSVPRLEHLMLHIWEGDSSPAPLTTLGHVPKLRLVWLESVLLSNQQTFTLSGCLSSSSSMLSTVYLNFRDELVWVRPEDPKLLRPVFLNLKQLYLHDIISAGCDLSWTFFLLEAAAPSLVSFHVKISWHTCLEPNRHLYLPGATAKANWTITQMPVLEPGSFKLDKLEFLEIAGFLADDKMTGYVRRIMDRAENLKRILLQGRDECKYCEPRSTLLGGEDRFFRVREKRMPPFPRNEDDKKLVRERLLVPGTGSTAVELIMERPNGPGGSAAVELIRAHL